MCIDRAHDEPLVVGERREVQSGLRSREGLKLRGIADRAGRVPRLRKAADSARAWSTLLEQWRAQLQTLVQEYLSGYAAVQPQRGACDNCHLHAFCRIEASL